MGLIDAPTAWIVSHTSFRRHVCCSTVLRVWCWWLTLPVYSQTLAIDKWNTDSVEEFLNLYLETSSEDEFDIDDDDNTARNEL